MIKRHPFLDFNWLWVLAGVTPIMVYFLLTYRNSSRFVFEALAATIVIYLVLALLHHRVHKTLTLEIGLEYVLTAALALIILQSLLF